MRDARMEPEVPLTSVYHISANRGSHVAELYLGMRSVFLDCSRAFMTKPDFRNDNKSVLVDKILFIAK